MASLPSKFEPSVEPCPSNKMLNATTASRALTEWRSCSSVLGPPPDKSRREFKNPPPSCSESNHNLYPKWLQVMPATARQVHFATVAPSC